MEKHGKEIEIRVDSAELPADAEVGMYQLFAIMQSGVKSEGCAYNIDDKVEKCKSEPGDITEDGAPGIIIGSIFISESTDRSGECYLVNFGKTKGDDEIIHLIAGWRVNRIEK